MRTLAIALVHYPVLDKAGALVTTAITNLDVHDLARSARTYGVSRYTLVHPILAQRALVERICEHWREGSSAKRIPDRKEALSIVEVSESLEETFEKMGGRTNLEVWITGARPLGTSTSLADAREALEGDGKPVLVLFGTGWGLAPSVVALADRILPPIVARSDSGYNHLSVRAACAIILDRLRG